MPLRPGASEAKGILGIFEDISCSLDLEAMGFRALLGLNLIRDSVSQSVSYFTVPPRAHPSTGSQSGSATPGRTQVPSTRSRGLLNCRK